MRNMFMMTTVAALLLAGCSTTKDLTAATVAAEETNDQTTHVEDEAMATFTAQQGTITSLHQTVDGLFAEATFDGNPITFLVFDDTPIVTNTGEDTTLQVGMTITGYVYSNSPMVMIYPPRYTPVLVVVETEEMGLYDVATFNDALINETNTLRLNSEDTLTAGDYAVFYTVSTRSIPAQTTPHRIIALTNPFTAAN